MNKEVGKINTLKKGVYVIEQRDNTFKVSNNIGSRDFPYQFGDIFKSKQSAIKFADKVAKNNKSKVQIIKYKL